MGTLSDQDDTDGSYPVKVDGQYVGMSGVGTAANSTLRRGFIRSRSPVRMVSLSKEIEIKRSGQALYLSQTRQRDHVASLSVQIYFRWA